MPDKLSNLLAGFRKNHSTQHYLMYMLQNWENNLDTGAYVCAMFMDLPKVFDTMRHGFSLHALQYMRSYLTNGQQRV